MRYLICHSIFSLGIFANTGCSNVSDEDRLSRLARCFEPGGVVSPADLERANALAGFETFATSSNGTSIYTREGLSVNFFVIHRYFEDDQFIQSSCHVLVYEKATSSDSPIGSLSARMEQVLAERYGRKPDSKRIRSGGPPSWASWTETGRFTGLSWLYWNEAVHEDNRKAIIDRSGLGRYTSIPGPIEDLVRPSYDAPFAAVQTRHKFHTKALRD